MTGGAGSIRLDKWLWHARFCKSRSVAVTLVAEGRVRVNSERAAKPARAIAPGDVLTFVLGGQVRVIRVIAAGDRRGPAHEAQALYEDLDPQGGVGAGRGHPRDATAGPGCAGGA